jgi:hypothetical protein
MAATFRPVVSTPKIKSRTSPDNMTIAILRTQERAILTIIERTSFRVYMTQVKAYPGIKKIKIKPETTRNRNKRLSIISRGPPVDRSVVYPVSC